MRLSTFLLLDRAPESTTAGKELYDTALALIRESEKIGLDGVWVAEHHFQSFGCAPNPAVFLAAAARETSRLQLGSAVAVLPFRHPVQVAEDYAMVDALSGGRLAFGAGSGTLPFEFDGFGLDPASKRPMFDESLDVLRKLWSGETVSGEVGVHRARDVRIQIQPTQKKLPIFIATTNPDGARATGQRGDHLLTLASPSLESLDSIGERLSAFTEGRRAAGLDPSGGHRVVMMFGHLAKDAATSRAEAGAAFDQFAIAHGMEADGLWDRMTEQRLALFASPDDARDIIAKLEGWGATELLLWNHFGELDVERVLSSLHRCRQATGK